MPKTSSIGLVILVDLRLVTDRHRQTERHVAIASTCASIASRGKNEQLDMNKNSKTQAVS